MKNEEVQLNSEKLEIQAKQIEFITSAAVGFPVVIAVGAGENNTREFQIMPVDEFESGIEDFWDWHVETNEQWFGAPLEAAAVFVFGSLQYAFDQCPNKSDEAHEEFQRILKNAELDFGKID